MDELRTNGPNDSHTRLVRVEEKLMHMESSMQDLKQILEKFMDQQIKHNDEKFGALERRVDKIYTIGAIGIFLVGPLITIIAKTVLAKFGI